jgi:hypothetical protein
MGGPVEQGGDVAAPIIPEAVCETVANVPLAVYGCGGLRTARQ